MNRAGVPAAALSLIPFPEREGVLEMLKQDELIDIIIPRGGESLIRFVVENSRIPVIKHYKGVCHIFVDASADCAMASEIIVTPRPSGLASAMPWKRYWVHRDAAAACLPHIAAALRCQKRRDPRDETVCALVPMQRRRPRTTGQPNTWN